MFKESFFFVILFLEIYGVWREDFIAIWCAAVTIPQGLFLVDGSWQHFCVFLFFMIKIFWVGNRKKRKGKKYFAIPFLYET